jgi:hypothetical protein
MRKITLTLFVLCFAFFTQAATVSVFNFRTAADLTSCGLSAPYAGADPVAIANNKTVTKGDVILTFKNKCFIYTYVVNGVTKYNILLSDDNDLGEFTLEPTVANEVITKVVFTGSNIQSTHLTINGSSDNYNYVSTTGTWTGSTNKFDLAALTYVSNGTTSNNKLYFSSITVTTEVVTPPAAPVFSLAAGTYEGAQTVSIVDADANAKIYYTLDGSTPTATSQLYSAPVSVTKSATLKAVAIDNGVSSSVTEAAYVINEAKVVYSIAEFNALSDGTSATFGIPLVAAFQSAAQDFTYVTDGSDFLRIDGAITAGLSINNIVKKGVKGEKQTTGGEIVMVPVDTTVKKGSLAVHAAALSIENITKFDVHDFIHMDDITVTQTAEGGTITDGTGTIQLVNKLGATLVFGAAKLQGFIGLDANGNKVIYPSLMTGPTGTINNAAPTNANVRTFNGGIAVNGAWKTIDIFNTAGQVVSHNRATVNCQPGAYLIKVDNKVTKVIVR